MSGRPAARILSSSDQNAVDVASELLRHGELIVIPTDTVYGIAASVDRPDAVARLYVAKGRPLDRPIPVLVSEFDQLARLTRQLGTHVEPFVRRFWPGGLTVVLEAAAWLPREIVGDSGRVGLRMPDHPTALAIIAAAGGALATTSANRSGQPAATSAGEALAALGHQAALVIDDGPSPGGVHSTVVAIDYGKLSLLREGAIPFDEIAPNFSD
jgi:L-threonylcarbamoyladenylate synthase